MSKDRSSKTPPIESTGPTKPRIGLLRRFGLAILVVGVPLVAGGFVFADWWQCLPDDAKPRYVGRDRCIECHQHQYEQWHGSHHDLAMDLATPETVLGDFNDAEFEHHGVTSRMFRRDGKYFIHTEGPVPDDGNPMIGKMEDFEIKYVFGVDPLQQYMVEFDRPPNMPENEIARVQVLRISWDTNKKEWFYLPPPDVPDKLAPADDLHWTGIAQRWNNMCADCHSTNLRKNYDVETATYHTTFSEIDVSCESCHGPGSLHAELAESKSLFWDRKRGYALPRLKGPENGLTEIETCATCHSRRRIVCPDFRPGDRYHDYFGNELLQRNTYHADGQIMDEVYVYGSFIQSKMYHKGVRCTDCHDPHSVQLKFEGNKVCTSCHQHPAGKYDGPAHHHHQPDSTGASCVECHMPETTYMEVDPRRDHSLRIPRPDLSVQLGTPNACTRCHVEIDVNREEEGIDDRKDLKQYQDWVLAARNGDQQIKPIIDRIDVAMAEAASQWYPGKSRRDKQHFAQVIDQARRGELAAEERLVETVTDPRLPAIVRATALVELSQFGTPLGYTVAQKMLEDPDPQLRAAAAANLQGLPGDRLIKSLMPMLDDPVRLVRVEAARVLAAAPGADMRGKQRRKLQDALEEYEAGLMTSNDRAGAHMTLGILYENLMDDDRAIDCYETAMRVEPTITGPRTNLAAVYDRWAEEKERAAKQRAMQRDRAGAMEIAEKAFEYRYRAQVLRKEELRLLARDAALLPDAAGLQYRYGMALYLQDEIEKAEAALLKAHQLEPNEPQFLLGLALFYQKIKNYDEAIVLARKLIDLRPDDPVYRQVLAEIQREQRGGPTEP